MLSLDVMDESGEHISEYDHDVYKERLDTSGKTILKEKSEGITFMLRGRQIDNVLSNSQSKICVTKRLKWQWQIMALCLAIIVGLVMEPISMV